MDRIEVAAGSGSYPVLVGSGAIQRLPELTSVHRRLAVLADSAFDPLKTRLPLPGDSQISWFSMPGGEASKTLSGLATVLDWLESSRIGRDGCLVVLGGGSLGDVGGLAASIWQRGIALYQVPTTLLAMVDSAVGGKTGINSAGSKNAIGTIWQPAAVVADPDLLASLPGKEFEAAFGEVVKYAVAMDAELFRLLEEHRDRLLARDAELLVPVISRCIRAKAGVVAADERDETGVREVLNYGHTIAHGIEAATGFRAAHGRAVAQGMRVAARIAALMGVCERSLVEAQDRLLEAYGLPGELPEARPDEILAALPSDKKARAGSIRWVLPTALGRAGSGHQVPPETVRRALAEVLA